MEMLSHAFPWDAALVVVQGDEVGEGVVNALDLVDRMGASPHLGDLGIEDHMGIRMVGRRDWHVEPRYLTGQHHWDEDKPDEEEVVVEEEEEQRRLEDIHRMFDRMKRSAHS